MLCQGMDFVFASSDFLTDEPGAYPGWPQATAALAVSDAIHTFLERACHPGFPLHDVPVQIEDWFRPAHKEKRIALMPRRRREDLLGAVQLVRRSGRLGDWEIVLIDGMTQQQVADELGRAAIFLFGAEREGVGLPGAEAMAAGCYVVGFTGDGAKEYMLPEHASVIADSDVVDMCDRTLEAMRWFERGSRDVRRPGASWARLGALAAQRATWCASGSGRRSRRSRPRARPSLLPAPVTLSHYQAHGTADDRLEPGARRHPSCWSPRARPGRGAARMSSAREIARTIAAPGLSVARRRFGHRMINWTPEFMRFGNHLYLWAWAHAHRHEELSPRVLIMPRMRYWIPYFPGGHAVARRTGGRATSWTSASTSGPIRSDTRATRVDSPTRVAPTSSATGC